MILSLFPISIGVRAQTMSGYAIIFSDGDSFTMKTTDGRVVKVRLYGIDAPERYQEYGEESRLALKKWLNKKLIFCTDEGHDRKGRLLSKVYVETPFEWACINEKLLYSGMAWHYASFDRNKEWSKLERDARKHKRGLWSKPHPIPPATYRKNNKAKK